MAAHPTSAVKVSGRSATAGAFTAVVSPDAPGQSTVAVSCCTGMNGKATASAVASTPSAAAALYLRRDGTGGGAIAGGAATAT
ncbi:hypothetical protein GCM10009609_10480 [Pseudonocardia aurantiaca]